MLQRLKEYAERIEAVQPAGYLKRRIKWELALGEDGRLLKALNLAEGGTGREASGMDVAAPSVVRSSGDRAVLLADTGEYVLGRPSRSDKQRREGEPFDPFRAAKVDNRHRLFKDLVRDCVAETREPDVQTVYQFLDRLTPFDASQDLRAVHDGARLPDDFEFGDQVTFSVSGRRPIELPAVKAFWERRLSGGASTHEPVGTCLVCGETRPLLPRMPMTIKGIPGGQSSGNALISANSPAFESYGLENSLIAGCCRPCAEAFHTGLQALISSPRSSLRDAEQVTVFWSRRDDKFLDLGIVDQPTPESVQALFRSPRLGQRAAIDAVEHPRDFFCLSLAASGSRIAVETWIETSVEQAKRSLMRYFLLQRLVLSPREEHDRQLIGHPVGLWRLQRTLLRSNAGGRDLPPKSVRIALLRTALTGAKIPASLLAQTVRRCQLEQKVSYERAVLIKMILFQKRESERPGMSESALEAESPEPSPEQWEVLDISFASPGYLCGRALAILEQIESSARRAQGSKVNTTLVDRYFTGASQSPYIVFPRLIQNAQNHLAKLRGQPAGFALEKRLGEILSGLKAKDGFPRTLDLNGQAEFCLGYYHQREDGFIQARLRRQERQAPNAGAAA